MDNSSVNATHDRLKAGAVGLLDAVVMSAAFVAPAAVVMFGNIYMAMFCGQALPLAYLISIPMVMTIAYSVGQLARKYPSAGAFYTYTSRALGPKAGFMSGWLLFVGYAFLVPAQSCMFGSWTHDILARYGVDIPWWLFSLLLTSLVTAMAIVGISLSMKSGLIGLAFEVTVVGILAAIIIAKGGASGHTILAFVPSDDFKGLNGVALALVFGIWGFVGFESSATLGEEVKNPTHTIPIAVMLSVVVLGVYYLFVSYAEVIGFGINPEGIKCLTKDTAAFDTLAGTFGGLWLRFLIDIAAMTSLFALHVATINSITRIVFAMGRENLLPKFLGKTSRHYHTPQASILTLWGFTVFVALVAGYAWGPANAFGYLAFLATLALIPLYMLINISVPIVYSRYFRTEFGIFRHLVVPVVGILGLIWVLKGNVYPVPDVPFNIFIYLIVAYIIAGLVVVQWLGRTRADLMAQAGMILAGVEGEQPMPSSSTN